MNVMLLRRRQSSVSLSDDYVTEAPLTVLQPFLIFIEEMISADVNHRNLKHRSEKLQVARQPRLCS